MNLRKELRYKYLDYIDNKWSNVNVRALRYSGYPKSFRAKWDNFCHVIIKFILGIEH